MKLAVPVIAGAAVLALANVAVAKEANLASANQPIALTEMQMDSVTAGQFAGFVIFIFDAQIAVGALLGAMPGNAFADVTIDVLSIGTDPLIIADVFAGVP